MSEPFKFYRPTEDEPDDLRGYVFQAIGAASTCWENPEGAGIFDSDRALEIGEALLNKIDELRPEHAQMKKENAQLRKALEEHNKTTTDCANENLELLRVIEQLRQGTDWKGAPHA